MSAIRPIVCAVCALAVQASLAGPLTPPAGAPTSTAKPLSEVEPRIALTQANAAGNASALFRIAQSGSYYLTENITGVGPGRYAIQVVSSNVTIDLNGFSIIGGGGETLSAIQAPNSNVEVRNGSIRSWSGPVITFGLHGVARHLRIDASGNNSTSIILGDGNVVEDCTFRISDPITSTGDGSTIRRCSFDQQGDAINAPTSANISVIDVQIDGPNTATLNEFSIDLGVGAFVSNTRISDDGRGGIRTGVSSIVTDCLVLGNGQGNFAGIVVGFNSVVTGCVVRFKQGAGIVAGGSSIVTGNACSNNAGDGINATSNSIISGNAVEANAGGGIAVSGGSFGTRVIDNVTRINNGPGIQVTEDAEVSGNLLDGDPIEVTGSDNVIDSNTITDNNPPITVSVAGNLIIRNRWSTGTPSIAAGNAFAPVATAATLGAAGPYDNIAY